LAASSLGGSDEPAYKRGWLKFLELLGGAELEGLKFFINTEYDEL